MYFAYIQVMFLSILHLHMLCKMQQKIKLPQSHLGSCSMSVIACKHMQIYAKYPQLCVPKVPNSPQTYRARGFVYFQIIEKYTNSTKEIDIFIFYFQTWGILVNHIFLSLLSLQVKMLYSFIIICTVDLMQAQFPFALRRPLRLYKTMSLHHFT